MSIPALFRRCDLYARSYNDGDEEGCHNCKKALDDEPPCYIFRRRFRAAAEIPEGVLEMYRRKARF